MKTGWPIALTLCAALPYSLAAAPLADQDRRSLLGGWRLDLDSMAIPVEARPAGVTADFAAGAGGEWTITYVISARDGAVRRMTSHVRPDGKAVPIEGDQLEADSVALATPAPGVAIIGLAKDGRPGSVRTYTLATDGGSMTESAANVGADGKPFIRTFRWVRVRAAAKP